MSWVVNNFLAAFLLPPLSLLLLFLLGLLILKHYPRSSRALLWSSWALFWLASTPYLSTHALQTLEQHTQPLAYETADAIVILGSGSYFAAPEYGDEDTVSERMLMRLRYGARLYRETNKPILIAGGTPEGNALSEAEQSERVLAEFNVPVQWLEQGSRNTYENARNAFALLQAEGIQRIYLVTHAWHMPRAAAIFRSAGFEVVEAPTAFTIWRKTTVLTFLPDAVSLYNSYWALHEWFGIIWYRLRYGMTSIGAAS